MAERLKDIYFISNIGLDGLALNVLYLNFVRTSDLPP